MVIVYPAYKNKTDIKNFGFALLVLGDKMCLLIKKNKTLLMKIKSGKMVYF